MGASTGILLLNLGGPATPADIRPFLLRLFSDREIIRLPLGPVGQWLLARIIVTARLPKVKRNYARIGGASPILPLTTAQAEGLEKRLTDRGHDVKVAIAFRYTSPTSDEAIDELTVAGVEKLLALTLYPHYSKATTGSSLAELRRAMARRGCELPLFAIERWPELPGYLDALSDHVRRAIMEYPSADRKGVFLLFSAHSLPMSFVDDGDPYVSEIEKTVAGIRERLPKKNPWRLAYQSRTGPVKWVGPGTDEVLRELAAEGVKNVLVIPVSFVSDHIETLYEVDLLFGDEARELGISGYRRIDSLNDDPRFLDALADLTEGHLG